MTLREYFLEGYEGNAYLLFDTDEQAFAAEDWDAEVFVETIFDKAINEVPKSVVYNAFKQVHKAYSKGYDISSEPKVINGNSLQIRGGSMKLNLRYNENFDLPNFEEE